MRSRSTLCLWALLAMCRPASADVEPREARDRLALDAEVIAGFTAAHSASGDASEFEARRLELGARWDSPRERWGAEVRLEGVRSSGPESLNGIDGNSMLARIKRGWAYGQLAPHPALSVEVRAGLVPDLWVERVETDYDLRALAPTTGEDARFLSAADAGASVVVSAFSARARLGVALTNGEGYRQTELNTGKTTSLVASVDAARFTLADAPARLVVHLGWVEGSTGVARLPAGRLMGALTLGSPRWAAGAEGLRADGAYGRAVRADAVGVYARGEVWPRWVGLAARYDRLNVDVDAADAVRERFSAGYYAEPFGTARREGDRLRVWVSVQRERAGQGAGPVVGAGALSDLTRALVLFDFSKQTEVMP